MDEYIKHQCMYAYIHTYTHMHTDIHTHVYIYSNKYIYIYNLYMHICTRIYKDMHRHIYQYMRTCMHTYTQNIHAYMHTCILTELALVELVWIQGQWLRRCQLISIHKCSISGLGFLLNTGQLVWTKESRYSCRGRDVDVMVISLSAGCSLLGIYGPHRKPGASPTRFRSNVDPHLHYHINDYIN